MSAKSSSKRLDALVVEHGLADSIAKAQAMILAGEVSVDGTRVDKAGTRFPQQAHIEVTSRAMKYVSRGGFKLEGALDDFGIEANGRVCLDIGSSTGGFTDCLVQRGALRVYAVDVNVDQIAWKLRNDPRVRRVSRNARDLQANEIREPIDLVVVDVSFISASKVLPPTAAAAKLGADFLILVKPQFELPRDNVGPGGIVYDRALHEKAIAAVSEAAARLGLELLGTRPSRLTGAEGNQEYFLHARKPLR
jgi:23S rRNA (cytidine1920-2'-O)/16S rRNA (cytidine1409-2'-O)-methyltransferase